MTISRRGSSGNSNLTLVGYPTVSAGDLLVLLTGRKYEYESSPPSGWTLQHQVQGGYGSPANNSGPVYGEVWTKIATGSESGAIGLSAPSSAGYGRVYSLYGAVPLNVAVTSGTDVTMDTTFSTTGADSLGLVSGDALLMLSIGNDNIALSDPSTSNVNVPGCVLTITASSTYTGSSTTTTGDDLAMAYCAGSVDSGSETSPPTHTRTGLSGNLAGLSLFVRVTEQDIVTGPPPFTGWGVPV